MSFKNIEADFYFTRNDFQLCTGRKNDIRLLNSRFKELISIIENTPLFKQEFRNFNGYVARTFNQGSKKFRDHMWLGFASKKYKSVRDGVQLQASITKEEPFRIELFVDQAVKPEVRQKIKLNLEKNRELFLELVRGLSNYTIRYFGRNENYDKESTSVTPADITQIMEQINRRGIYFSIGISLSLSETTKINKQIVPQIILSWLRLRGLHDLMVFGKVNKEYSKTAPTPIDNEGDLIKNIALRYSLKGIDLDETEERASKRESKQITYETNWLAQEKANSSHRKTVKLLAGYLMDHGVTPKQSVIDTLCEKNKNIFIFEVKSIHSGNFIHQTRMALGQLLDYEYFQIKTQAENKGKSIVRGIVYNKKPTEIIIDFLKTYEFFVFWTKGKNLSGDKGSMKILDKFLSHT